MAKKKTEEQESESTPSIEMKVRDLLQAERALTRLSAEKIHFAASFNVSRMLIAVREVTGKYKDEHDALVRELGAERPPNAIERRQGLTDAVVAVKPEHREVFNAKVKKMEDAVVAIERKPISLATLKRGCPTCEEDHVIEIEPETLAVLGALITE